MDLCWTAWPTQTNALFENIDGDGSIFEDISLESLATDSKGRGISDNTADIDNVAWEDYLVTNGFDASTAANALFRNNGDRTFSNLQGVLPRGLDFDGRGDRRVYASDFRAEDELGGSCFGLVQVCTPHDRGRGNADCGLGDLIHDSTSGVAVRREKVDSSERHVRPNRLGLALNQGSRK